MINYWRIVRTHCSRNIIYSPKLHRGRRRRNRRNSKYNSSDVSASQTTASALFRRRRDLARRRMAIWICPPHVWHLRTIADRWPGYPSRCLLPLFRTFSIKFLGCPANEPASRRADFWLRVFHGDGGRRHFMTRTRPPVNVFATVPINRVQRISGFAYSHAAQIDRIGLKS